MIVAIDQFGRKIWLDGKAPRKELLEKLGARHAEKVYRDSPDGGAKHVGYVVYDRWFELFEPWHGGRP
jgi:hypothetical protein